MLRFIPQTKLAISLLPLLFLTLTYAYPAVNATSATLAGRDVKSDFDNEHIITIANGILDDETNKYGSGKVGIYHGGKSSLWKINPFDHGEGSIKYKAKLVNDKPQYKLIRGNSKTSYKDKASFTVKWDASPDRTARCKIMIDPAAVKNKALLGDPTFTFRPAGKKDNDFLDQCGNDKGFRLECFDDEGCEASCGPTNACHDKRSAIYKELYGK